MVEAAVRCGCCLIVKNFGFGRSAPLIGGLVPTYSQNVSYWAKKARGSECSASNCVDEDCILRPTIDTSVAYIVQSSFVSHVGKYYFSKPKVRGFQPFF